jgi:hypothetical protein
MEDTDNRLFFFKKENKALASARATENHMLDFGFSLAKNPKFFSSSQKPADGGRSTLVI